MTRPDEWTCSHFGISIPRGRTQGDSWRLLGRLATSISALGPDTMTLDATLNDKIDENGPWWTASVYYARDGLKRLHTCGGAGGDTPVSRLR